MSTSEQEEALADNRTDIARPPEERPILSSLPQWPQSTPKSLSQLDERLEVRDSEDEDSEDESESSESENEGAESRGGHKRSDRDSWLRRNERQHFTITSLKYYWSLLDQMEIDSNIKPRKPSEDQPAVSTRIGQVEWPKEEEDKLFSALSRKGKDRIQEIAEDIGSKSQSEVLEYTHLLDKAARHGIVQGMQALKEKDDDHEDEELDESEDEDESEGEGEGESEDEDEEAEEEEEGGGGKEKEQEQEQEQEQSPLAITIPAALEINEGLEKALDIIARHVSVLEQRMDDVEREKVHGPDFWTINNNAAEKIEETLGSKTNEQSLRSNIFQTAGLLNIKQWIRLSEKLFMNAGESHPEDNWRNLAFEGESPSLTADAFNDFYTITRDITKRLMETTLSAAQDRVTKARKNTAKVVKRDDVVTATELLQMRSNSFQFYINLPRRLRLDVAEIFNRKEKQGRNQYLSYEEVEKKLCQEDGPKIDGKGSKGKQKKDISDDGDEIDLQEPPISNEAEGSDVEFLGVNNRIEIPDSEDEDTATPSQPDDETSIQDESSHEDIHTYDIAQLEYDQKLDEYLDYFDRQSSKQAHADLRALFRTKSFQFSLDDEEDIEEAAKPPPTMPTMPVTTSQVDDTAVEWRTELVYRAEWEAYKKTNLRKADEEIASNNSKRRRIQ